MLEELFNLSRHFLKNYNRAYIRYFLKKYNLHSRFSIITGQRGVGKSTALIQKLLVYAGNDILSKKILYIQADHFLIGKYSLYEISEEFYNKGGEIICFDEIHKYPDWSIELKSIYDTFMDLIILASGSSALEIYKGSHDLSRRAIIYKMQGMSFREFLELSLNKNFVSYSLKTILEEHEQIANKIIEKLANKKILSLFEDYLTYGYYPYYLEYKDKALFYIALEQNIHTTIEADLLSIYPSLTGISIKKIKKLLSFIAGCVPFIPDIKKLKEILEIGDERTLKTYLKYLEDAGIILQFAKSRQSLKGLGKPEKIYLNNTCQLFALKGTTKENIGTVREIFFVNMLYSEHNLSIPNKGDFLIDGELLFEIGGKKKSYSQIKDIQKSFLAIDDIESGFGNKIPLWLFGFLY
ncbi:MAG: ATP-binding protein [bacterium]